MGLDVEGAVEDEGAAVASGRRGVGRGCCGGRRSAGEGALVAGEGAQVSDSESESC